MNVFIIVPEFALSLIFYYLTFLKYSAFIKDLKITLFTFMKTLNVESQQKKKPPFKQPTPKSQTNTLKTSHFHRPPSQSNLNIRAKGYVPDRTFDPTLSV